MRPLDLEPVVEPAQTEDSLTRVEGDTISRLTIRFGYPYPPGVGPHVNQGEMVVSTEPQMEEESIKEA
jgi:hypothetical protein